MKFVVDLPEDTLLTPGMVIHTLGFPEPDLRFLLRPPRPGGLGRHLRPQLVRVPHSDELPLPAALRSTPPPLGRRRPRAPGRLCSSPGAAASHSWPETASLSHRRELRLDQRPHLLRGGRGLRHRNLAGRGRHRDREAGQPFTRENLERPTLPAGDGASWSRSPWWPRRRATASRRGWSRAFWEWPSPACLAGGSPLARSRPTRPRRSATWRPSTPARSRPRRLLSCAPNAQRRASRSTMPSWTASGGLRLSWMEMLVSHQDALLVGGKVARWYADHVVFLDPEICRTCQKRVCVDICSAEALRPGDGTTPAFDREKCVHCGACLWSCPTRLPGSDRVNLQFRAGAGGLHSAEN